MDLMAQRDSATVDRAKEKGEYGAAKADDETALQLIEKAAGALSKFYEDNGLAGLQVGAGAHQHQAPPPPPTTWSEPYGGAKGESNGVQGILGMIKTDIEKDIKTATEEETTDTTE